MGGWEGGGCRRAFGCSTGHGGLKHDLVRAKIWCRELEKVSGAFEIFRNMCGFVMRVERETGGPLAPNPPSPPANPCPPTDKDPDDAEDLYHSLNTSDWDAAGDKGKA